MHECSSGDQIRKTSQAAGISRHQRVRARVRASKTRVSRDAASASRCECTSPGAIGQTTERAGRGCVVVRYHLEKVTVVPPTKLCGLSVASLNPPAHHLSVASSYGMLRPNGWKKRKCPVGAACYRRRKDGNTQDHYRWFSSKAQARALCGWGAGHYRWIAFVGGEGIGGGSIRRGCGRREGVSRRYRRSGR